MSIPTLRLGRWPRLGLVVLTGLALGLAWEPYGWWPLAFLAPVGLTLLVAGQRLRTAFGLGYLFALAMLTLSIGWIRVLGLPVAAGLIVFMALFYGLLAVGITLVSRLRGWQVWVAACWVLAEFVFSRQPFGGFGWTRLAYAAVDSPLSGWYPWVGMAGVTFAVVLSGHLLLSLILHAHQRRWSLSKPVAVTAALLIAIQVLGLAGQRIDPVVGAADHGTVTVGVVQGNVPGRGLDAMGEMRSVTNNHLSETVNLATRGRLGLVPPPDFILWPESSTDIDPTQDPLTARTIEAAADAAGVPIFVGAVTYGPGADERQTTGIWWDPQVGPTASYHKRNLVPFGEWIPFRDVLLPRIPMLQMVGAQGVPGTEPGVLPVRLMDGRELRVGDVICFELAYDRTVHEMIGHGAQVVVVQSNNATYGGTGQIEQQFAITRARAMETRREIAVATTNSVSGSIDRHGNVLERTEEFTAASLAVPMPVRDGLTPAVLVGAWLDRGLALLGLLAIAYGVARRSRSRSSARTTSTTVVDVSNDGSQPQLQEESPA